LNAVRTVVLIKPTPDATSTDGWVIGSLDLYALSHGLELGGSTHVVVVGPRDSGSVCQRALASGADEATHVVLEDPGNGDALALSKMIRDAVVGIPYDLILAGQSSDDIETGVIGPMLAELLDLPHVSTVTRIETDGDRLRVQRDVVGGKQVLSVATPAVLVILSGREIPLRYPTPRGMIGARKKPMNVVSVATPLATHGISWTPPALPERSGDGEILRDLPAADAAKRIADWLRDRGLTG
jgi:electron transfer flavoprotein beta subunit